MLLDLTFIQTNKCICSIFIMFHKNVNVSYFLKFPCKKLELSFDLGVRHIAVFYPFPGLCRPPCSFIGSH